MEFEDLLEDELLQRGVIRSREIIGEASKNVSPELKKEHPEIEWKMMAAMRDKLIHHYFQKIWNVLTTELPLLKSILRGCSRIHNFKFAVRISIG